MKKAKTAPKTQPETAKKSGTAAGSIKKWLDFDLDIDSLPVPPPRESVEDDGGDETPLLSRIPKSAPRFVYTALAVICSIVLTATLILTVEGMPRYGEDQDYMDTVTYEYITHGMEYTGAVNIVAGIILEYRAFDTLGESFVLFCAVTCVLVLLRADSADSMPEDVAFRDLSHDAILRRTVRAIVPLVFMFGVYVLLNGHLSPGGGFSGGAVIGAGLVMVSAAYGGDVSGRIVSERVFKIVTTCALSFYCLGKSYTFFTGANGLHSIVGNGTPGDILSAGLILPLNVAVGMVVACTVYGIYRMFDKRSF